jgi:hypothetical protein
MQSITDLPGSDWAIGGRWLIGSSHRIAYCLGRSANALHPADRARHEWRPDSVAASPAPGRRLSRCGAGAAEPGTGGSVRRPTVQVQVQVCFTSVCGQVQPLDVALSNSVRHKSCNSSARLVICHSRKAVNKRRLRPAAGRPPAAQGSDSSGRSSCTYAVGDGKLRRLKYCTRAGGLIADVRALYVQWPRCHSMLNPA